MILQRNRSALQNNHLCRIRRKHSWRSWRAALREIITKIAGPVSTTTQPTRGITQPVGLKNMQLKPSGGGVRQAANMPHNPAGPATNNQNGVQVNISELPRADLYILFGVKGPRHTLELEQIAVKENSDDNAFFQSLKQSHKKHRGFWRYRFSVWQLTHCDFVKVRITPSICRLANNGPVQKAQSKPHNSPQPESPRRYHIRISTSSPNSRNPPYPPARIPASFLSLSFYVPALHLPRLRGATHRDVCGGADSKAEKHDRDPQQ